MKNCVHHVNSNYSTNTSNVAKILHFNARSLIPKTRWTQNIVCDIWAYCYLCCGNLAIRGYFRCWDLHPWIVCYQAGQKHAWGGGGIAIYVQNNIMVNTLLYKSSGLEFMLVSLYNSTSKLCIGLLYCPPSSLASVFETLYFHLLDQLFF